MRAPHWLFPQLCLHHGPWIVAEIIAATLGAVLLLVIVRLVRRGGAVSRTKKTMSNKLGVYWCGLK